MAALLVLAAGCAVIDTPLAQDDPGPLHVRALTVDPEDDQALLASGHPALGADHLRVPDLPPNLGLVRSDNGGRTWTEASLLVEADFHTFAAAAADLLLGADATTGRLPASTDGGRTWMPVTTQPAVLAATERGFVAADLDG